MNEIWSPTRETAWPAKKRRKSRLSRSNGGAENGRRAQRKAGEVELTPG